jgi:hypothetical protein
MKLYFINCWKGETGIPIIMFYVEKGYSELMILGVGIAIAFKEIDYHG